MSSTDVRSILDLPARENNASTSAGQATAPRRGLPGTKKPDGISRELYALIGDNAPFLAETQATLSATKYRERPKPKHKDAKWYVTRRCWMYEAEDAGRWFRSLLWHDNLWVVRIFDIGSESVTDNQSSRVSRTGFTSLTSVEYFGAFNVHGPSIMEYSQYEYDQHLTDPGWTEHETAYLFNLLREYDLRFIVVADRYMYARTKGDQLRSRSVEVSSLHAMKLMVGNQGSVLYSLSASYTYKDRQ